MTTEIIRLENVGKRYDDFQVLQGINLSVRQGEKIVICGPSGSGKSTLIRCINRLSPHDTGTITVEIDNDVWQGQNIGPQDVVEIHGELDKDLFSAEIDVDRIVKQ